MKSKWLAFQVICDVTLSLGAKGLKKWRGVERARGSKIPKIQSDTKKWERLKNPTKIEEIQEKKFIDRI